MKTKSSRCQRESVRTNANLTFRLWHCCTPDLNARCFVVVVYICSTLSISSIHITEHLGSPVARRKKTCSVFSCSVQWQKQKCTRASGPSDPLLAVHLNASFGLYPITDLLSLSNSVISKPHFPLDMTCHHRPRKAEVFLHSAGFLKKVRLQDPLRALGFL